MTSLTVALPGDERTVRDATAAEVIAAITSMRGEGEVWLGDPGTRGLGISGGPDRFFVGYVAPLEGVVLQALAEDPPSEALEAVIGSQPTTLEPKYLVARDVAVAVSLYFLDREKDDPSVGWERQ